LGDSVGFGIADLDGNGMDDFARVGAEDGPGFRFLWGEADGSFTPAELPQEHWLHSTLALADFNRDGLIDMASTRSVDGDEVAVFRNLGGRLFASPETYKIPNKRWAELMPGDFNGDGAIDLFILYDGTKVLFNRGDGTFLDQEPKFLEREWPRAFGDFNRDGVDDLFYSEGVTFLFRNPQSIYQPTTSPERLHYPEGFWFAAAADLNADGNLDVAIQGGTPSLLFLEGTGDGGFRDPAGAVPHPGSFYQLLAGDFDEDGLADLAGVTEAGFYLLRNLGEQSTFRRGEINGDQRIDLSDAISHLGCLFLGRDSCTPCLDARDVNDDARMDISDAVALLSWLFEGAAPPPEPFTTCGRDTTPDAFDCSAVPSRASSYSPRAVRGCALRRVRGDFTRRPSARSSPSSARGSCRGTGSGPSPAERGSRP
jgi:hypothetical protein